jgi:hypothetical protein
MIIVPSRPYQSEITLILGITICHCLRWEKTFVVAIMGGIAVLLLLKWEAHVGNLHITSQMRNVAASVRAGAVGAFVRGIKTTWGAIKPVVVSFDGVLGVAAVAGVPSTTASTSITSTSSSILVVV